MTNEEIRGAIIGALRRIAPEADPASLRGAVPLRDQVDLDSMDFLNFLVAIHDALGVEVPESAYTEVATLEGCVAYVAARLPASAEAPHAPA